MSDMEGPAEGPGSFLFGMARLQNLTEVSLSPPNGLDWPPVGPAYSSLMASSKLVSFSMFRTRLPEGAWRFVFPAAHKLPHLTVFLPGSEESVAGLARPRAWDAADMCSFVSCCPNLRHIEVPSPQHGPHVFELRKLTTLTFLALSYGSWELGNIEEPVKGLAALTQLQGLTVNVSYSVSQEVTMGSLLPLTSLMALAQLKFECVSGGGEASDSGGDRGLRLQLWWEVSHFSYTSGVTCTSHTSRHPCTIFSRSHDALLSIGRHCCHLFVSMHVLQPILQLGDCAYINVYGSPVFIVVC